MVSSKRIVRVALLLCDSPNPAVQAEYGTYIDIFRSLLLDSLQTLPKRHQDEIELVLDGYDVVGAMEYPSVDSLRDRENGYDAVMMTGSQYTAHDDGLPWLGRLISFVRDLAREEDMKHVKIIGICFGMQIIARALGGSCVRNDLGWEIGVYDVELTDVGKEWIGRTGAKAISEKDRDGERVVMDDDSVLGGGEGVDTQGKKVMSIQQMHRDHVPTLPPTFHLIGSTPKCPIQGMLQYYPSSSLIHILAVQGHPEFLPRIVSHMVDLRSKTGLFDEETTKEARRRLGMREGGDGRGVIGWGIWQVILEEGA